MSTKKISLDAVRQRVNARRARAADRREHDIAMRDPRVAMEHFAARERAVHSGERDCIYCG